MNIVIVGGHGIIGTIFTTELRSVGHTVLPFGRADWTNAECIFSNADMVLVSVPLDKTTHVIHEVVKYINPSTILADVASVKAPAMRAMLDLHIGPVVGLHPMFGPGTPNLIGQTVVVCPGQGNCDWFIDFLHLAKAEVLLSTPEEHDEMMNIVQAVRFYMNLLLGVFLAEEGVDMNRVMEFASPMFRIQMSMVTRLVSQDEELYSHIMTANGDRCLTIDRLNKLSNRLSRLVLEQDTQALCNEFQFAHSHLLFHSLLT